MSDQIIIQDSEQPVKPPRPPIPDGWRQEKDEHGRLWTYDENGKNVCGAWIPKRNKFCQRVPSVGRNRCKFHGGESLRGFESPTIKHGRYSVDLPTQLASRYQEARTDGELLSMRDDIALIQAKIGDQLAGMQQGESGELWVEARRKYRQLMDALRRDDNESSTQLIAELGQILESGYKDYMAWNEIQKSIEQKRKLSESERKRLVDLHQMITTEELMLVVGALVDSIRQNVSDTHALSNISKDVRSLLEKHGLDKKAGD